MILDLPTGKKVKVVISHDKNDRYHRVSNVTTAEVSDPENVVPLGVGRSKCFAGDGEVAGDQFVRHEGVRRAVARALKETDLTRAERAAVWDKVWNGRHRMVRAKDLKVGQKVVLPANFWPEETRPADRTATVRTRQGQYGVVHLSVQLADGGYDMIAVAPDWLFKTA